MVMKEIAGQIQSGDFSLSMDSYGELKRDHLALTVTVVDVVNGAAYLFETETLQNQRNWKEELELEQLRQAIGHNESENGAIERAENS